MKTAISVPDETFHRVDQRAAELHMNRSEFFSRAAERYLDALDALSLTREIDAAVLRSGTLLQAETATVTRVGRERLAALTADDEW
ncbi:MULTISPECIES: ribbon-helix-helix protein, CopG family [Subtercola]|uniref:Ribbon-helix-helix protein, CopG family n=1 Tax=Subtercola vilae TaxID=2056433 RepID=A0A4T2C4P8_9MICO|nr:MULTISPECIES: ribbon-helix-helix protein, CopG family [Subtercola]MEA9985452.1 ribbon-helix-helix protein, CopG family [Subtercola sp. RTI3]TIH39323.1 ribbon-helix-helix protein, CopG family [Subtercola vilae]